MLSENIKNEIFNVGSGQTYSVNSLVKLLGDNKVVYIPKRPGEPDCTFADISKILKKLDGDLKFHLKMALKNLWNLLMILKMPQFGIHYPLKMKQKIGLNIFLKLDFVNNENKNTFESFIKNKICSIDLLEKISKSKKNNKNKIILCHGTFDLLHAGHFRHFQDSKNLGDILFVTITSDNFINKAQEDHYLINIYVLK